MHKHAEVGGSEGQVKFVSYNLRDVLLMAFEMVNI